MKTSYINAHCHQIHDLQDWNMLNILSPLDYDSNQWCSVGIHPWYALEAVNKKWDVALYEWIHHRNVRAIGECGLDKVCSTPWELQVRVFAMQIEWALECRKPLMIHCVRSQQEVLQALKRFNGDFVFHGFNRNLEMAVQVVHQGGYLSLNEIFLKSKQGREVVKQIPLNRLFLETDNEAVSVRRAYLCLSQLLDISEHDIAQQLWQNALEIGLIKD
ncbi:MAG: hypothetical protein RLY35_1900 [Bacteroidota bacterium]|jgi:TatD DNase family protein